MGKIYNKEMDITAACLEWYVGHVAEEKDFSYRGFISTTDKNKPSIREAFDALVALPEEHPLRKKHDLAKVRAGYDSIVAEDMQNRSYQSLHRFMWAV